MTKHKTSDPYCNAVMERWNQATANGDRRTQQMFVALCEKHKGVSIDWQRVAEDAGIKVPNPISEDRAIALHDALAGLVYEVGRIIDHSGSTDLITAHNRSRSLLNEPDRPADWITQDEAKALARSLESLTTQVDRLLAAGLNAGSAEFITALKPSTTVGRRATSLERMDGK